MAKYPWPKCSPPDNFIIESYTLNDVQYKKQEVEPGEWQWVPNEEATKRKRDSQSSYDQKRQDLWWALRTRVLTDDEMRQVRMWGSSLNTPTGVSYSAIEKSIELNNALAEQAKLRMLAESLKLKE